MRFAKIGKKIDDVIDSISKALRSGPTPTVNPSARERFDRWFTAPVKVLSKELDHGDGAFVVMSMGFFLCERYFRSVTETTDDHTKVCFKNRAADELDVNRDFFEDFWNIYRHGIQHQGSPKGQVIAKRIPNTQHSKPGYPISYKWRIDGSFDSLPQKWLDSEHTYICIDPFGFTQRIIALWHEAEPRMAELTNHRLGEIRDWAPINPVSVRSTDTYP